MSTTTNTEQKKLLSIEIVSDTVCPWCFVGKRRLEKALKQLSSSHPDVQIDLKWAPFFLNPNAPFPSRNKLEMYKQKFGPERVSQMVPHMIEVGKSEGIKFSFGGNTGRTLDSHRLLEYVLHEHGAAKQNELTEVLFKNYFEEEKDIVDLDVLVSAGVSIGLDGPTVRSILTDETKFTGDVQNKVQQNYQRQVTGVPHFIIDGKHHISGAQNPEVFLSVFQKFLSK